MPQDIGASAKIDELIRILERMSDLSSGILQAGIAGDERGTRERVDLLRQEKSYLLSKNRVVGEKLKEASLETMRKTQELLDNISKSEEFVTAWCSRYRGIVDHQIMMESPERCHDLIDEIMPAAWDWKNDILIIPNWVSQDFVSALYARGQKRVCIFEYYESTRFISNSAPFYINSEKACFEYFTQSEVYESARIIYISIATPKELQNEEHQQHADKLLEDFKMAFVHRIANLNTVRLQGARLLKQGLNNLPAVADAIPFSKMIGQFDGCPMLIVSPGPSLDKNIDQIKNFKGRALIVAPAQTALALTAEGVIPDIVVIADPNEMQYLLNGVPMDQVTALVLGVTCHPALYKQYTGKIITFNANLGLDTWISDIFEDTTKLPAGGSVSTDALCMGVFLKCSPIIIVGQDLSFAGDKQYSSQSADGQVKVVTNQEANTVSYSNFTEGLKTVFNAGGFDSLNFNEPLRKLPGYYGGIVFTKTDYAIFHTEFEQIAEDVKEQELGIELLNCTEGGAYIKGFNHISLRRAYDMVSELKQGTDLTVKLRNILMNKDTSSRRQKLAKSLNIMRINLHAAGTSAAKCRQLAQKATRSGQIDSLAVEEKNLIALVQKTLFISLAAQEKIVHALKLGSEAQSLPESLAASNILYRVITEVTHELIPVVDQTLRGLRKDIAG
jgi:hypothetical protein